MCCAECGKQPQQREISRVKRQRGGWCGMYECGGDDEFRHTHTHILGHQHLAMGNTSFINNNSNNSLMIIILSLEDDEDECIWGSNNNKTTIIIIITNTNTNNNNPPSYYGCVRNVSLSRITSPDGGIFISASSCVVVLSEPPSAGAGRRCVCCCSRLKR